MTSPTSTITPDDRKESFPQSAQRPPVGVIHVLYPRGYRSGGPEALHQLVQALRTHGADAYLVPEVGTENEPRHPSYEHYDAPERPAVDDVAGNAVITPEKGLKNLRAYRNADLYCWWLSIDMATPWRDFRGRYDQWSATGELVEPSLKWRAKALARNVGLHLRGDYRQLPRLRHLTQSEYARSYLYARANLLATMVSDFTPLAGLSEDDLPGGRTTVTYNPAKAREAVAALRRRMPDVEFVPLENMTRDQVVEALRRSIVFLDLGYHPGKDRMPREAALCGAVSVVARRGSGAFSADVPIPWQHKVSPEGDFVGNAARVLRGVLQDPDGAKALQAGYRDVIRAERATFTQEVREAFIEQHLDSV